MTVNIIYFIIYNLHKNFKLNFKRVKINDMFERNNMIVIRE